MNRAAVSRVFRVGTPIALLCLVGVMLDAPTPCRAIPAPVQGPEEVLRAFLAALAEKDVKGAHALVAPSTKEKGDPIADRAKADQDNFAAEAASRAHAKFAAYTLGNQRRQAEGQVRIMIHFECGDNDEALLVCEGGRWYVADPVHIIR